MGMLHMNDHQFVFIAGLHRSGTSLLFQGLREHPEISGFRDTGVPEDEGQHLQSVYPPAFQLGGPGRFAFAGGAHLTEESSLVSPKNREKLFSQWRPFWDLQKPWLLEKTPQNLVQTRFLRAMFPNSRFIVMLRHPMAVACATQRWSRTSLHELVNHWVYAHELFENDRRHLEHVLVLRYEEFVAAPEQAFEQIYEFLGVPYCAPSLQVRSDVNRKYFARWEKIQRGYVSRYYADELVRCFESRANHFGYSLRAAEPAAAFQRLVAAAERVDPGQSVGRMVSQAYRAAASGRANMFRSYKDLKRVGRKITHTSRKRRAAVHGHPTAAPRMTEVANT